MFAPRSTGQIYMVARFRMGSHSYWRSPECAEQCVRSNPTLDGSSSHMQVGGFDNPFNGVASIMERPCAFRFI
jgi:hypothetical protein